MPRKGLKSIKCLFTSFSQKVLNKKSFDYCFLSQLGPWEVLQLVKLLDLFFWVTPFSGQACPHLNLIDLKPRIVYEYKDMKPTKPNVLCRQSLQVKSRG